jgi:invasion protein IalB
MGFSFVTAPARAGGRTLVLGAATALVLLAPGAFAQQAPQPKAQKAQPKGKQPPAQAPAQPAPQAQQPPQQPPQQQGQPGAGGEQPLPVVYSPWTKFCGKDEKVANSKTVCITMKEARLESGQFLAAAQLIEPEGETKKALRVLLPLGMQLPTGSRVVLDQDAAGAKPGRFVVCLPNGCLAETEVDQEFIGNLKKSQNMWLQAINIMGQAVSYPLPLADFAKANEGPATDPKAFQEQQEKLQAELQKKAEDARKRLQQRQPGAPGAAAPAPTQAR